jgi:hypothetical protein
MPAVHFDASCKHVKPAAGRNSQWALLLLLLLLYSSAVEAA